MTVIITDTVHIAIIDWKYTPEMAANRNNGSNIGVCGSRSVSNEFGIGNIGWKSCIGIQVLV